ncbi:MAG: hypothetical protein WKF59_06285 [Chitinophagaceae bacterium]
MAKNKLVAYTRLMPAGLAYEEISIGRVVTSPIVRAFPHWQRAYV